MISEQVDQELRAAGWRPGRQIDVTGWRDDLEAGGYTSIHRAAISFLTEFGGIRLDNRGPGITSVREAFEFDPTLALGEDDRFIAWSERVNRRIVPIGVLDNGRYFLGIDEFGEIY